MELGDGRYGMYQGKARISRPRSRYLSYNACRPSYWLVKPHWLAVLTI